MTAAQARDAAPAAILLLDVEGTTTPVRFVVDVLFPYARSAMAGFLDGHADDPEVRFALALLQEERARERGGSAALEPLVRYAQQLMDEDRKSPGLKLLQGKIWDVGYREGQLRGEVYPDVPVAFYRWRREGRSIGIFSSGSVLAQRLLFGSTTAGDLTPSLRWHFDTSTGPKGDPESYRRIARAMEAAPGDVLFVSDSVAELDAARLAGMRTALCVREGATPPSSTHPVVRGFDQLA